MRLIWKVLRQNLSIGQFLSFFVANIIGLTIIVLGIQFYQDIHPIVSNKAGFMSPDFLVLTKPVTTLDAMTGAKTAFKPEEIRDIEKQPFVNQVGTFTAAQYRIWGQVVVKGYGIDIGTDLFFESVPDEFIDIESEEWKFTQGDEIVPIIIPRTYINLYNFGYAPASDFPVISENLINKVILNLTLWGNNRSAQMKGKIIGFSSRLNTILVPRDFIEWSNSRFAPYANNGDASRIIISVTNPADERIAEYCKQHELNIEGNNLNASKAAWLMRLLVTMVMLIGLIICLLAGYVLMISIFLLLERNHEAVRNLKYIGYISGYLAIPYQAIVIGINLLSVLTAMSILAIVRSVYLNYLTALAPELQPTSMVITWAVSLATVLVMSIINARIIYVSINK